MDQKKQPKPPKDALAEAPKDATKQALTEDAAGNEPEAASIIFDQRRAQRKKT